MRGYKRVPLGRQVLGKKPSRVKCWCAPLTGCAVSTTFAPTVAPRSVTVRLDGRIRTPAMSLSRTVTAILGVVSPLYLGSVDVELGVTRTARVPSAYRLLTEVGGATRQRGRGS